MFLKKSILIGLLGLTMIFVSCGEVSEEEFNESQKIEFEDEEPEIEAQDSVEKLIPGLNGDPIPLNEVSYDLGWMRKDTCLTFITKDGGLAIFMDDKGITTPYGGYSLDELAKLYSLENDLVYDDVHSLGPEDSVLYTYPHELKIKNSTFTHACDEVEGCFDYLDLKDSLININGIYIGMSKSSFFDRYPEKVGLNDEIDRFVFNTIWMICLWLEFDNGKLISIKTDSLF